MESSGRRPQKPKYSIFGMQRIVLAPFIVIALTRSIATVQTQINGNIDSRPLPWPR